MHNKPKNLICEIVFGSNLYGTATETSDTDYIGIFLPTPEEILLGRIPKTADTTPKDDTRKNLPGELDCTYYSLHHFLRLATQGQTVAIDMLFAPDSHITKTEEFGWVWDAIREHRDKFLSRKMNAFVGYARGQASKFSLKGERLNNLKDFAYALGKSHPDARLDEAWEFLPKDDERVNPNGIRELQIGGKWFGENTNAVSVRGVIHQLIEKYGNRAKTSADAGGLDWKALSHAVRVSKELMELLNTGGLVFPLKDAPLLLDIKQGKLPIEEVRDILDGDLAIVEELSSKSLLPDKVHSKFWDEWMTGVLAEYVAKSLADRKYKLQEAEVAACIPRVLEELTNQSYPFKVAMFNQQDHDTGYPQLYVLACVEEGDQEYDAMEMFYDMLTSFFKHSWMYSFWATDKEEFYACVGDNECIASYASVDMNKHLGSLCKPKTPIVLSIARDFSETPGARFPKEGKWSGEEFREGPLKKAIDRAMALGYQLTVDLDGSAGYGTSFLEEAFGGLVRKKWYTLYELEKLMTIVCCDEPWLVEEIREYMMEASKNV